MQLGGSSCRRQTSPLRRQMPSKLYIMASAMTSRSAQQKRSKLSLALTHATFTGSRTLSFAFALSLSRSLAPSRSLVVLDCCRAGHQHVIAHDRYTLNITVHHSSGSASPGAKRRRETLKSVTAPSHAEPLDLPSLLQRTLPLFLSPGLWGALGSMLLVIARPSALSFCRA